MIRKKVSILGDSVSTYEGFTPDGFAFYGEWNARETGVASAKDTWWRKVIGVMGWKLARNNSMSGSLVAGRLLTSGTSIRRIKDLAANGMPDVILVAMGANDWGFSVLPEEFESEYRNMLQLLKLTYPDARIWCATLPEAEEPDQEYSFFNVDAVVSKRVYSDIIRKAAAEADLEIADLAAGGQSYQTIDGVHPNREGMQTLANLWISALKK